MTINIDQSPLQSALIGRQAILDVKQEIYAYELLYRDGNQNRASILDGNEATARVLVNTFCEMG
ncbi:MAG: hypothetical protein KC643_19160, partial [Nitrospira sp.]|nr:hypothetical protein [Nitrospira sp.]